MTDNDDVKLNGEEQGIIDEAVSKFGDVEREVGQAMVDEHMQSAGLEKTIKHGDINDVEDAIKDQGEHEAKKEEENQ